MQNDEVIWQIINYGFCSFKSKIARERTFCQNPYNVTGLCLRSACPLANSQYATIREEDGACYLFIKTIERAHTPKNLWEKIRLPSNYAKALEMVSQLLEFFPKHLQHRNKQRLTKIHQMLIRMRKLQLKAKPKIVTTNTKIEQREKGREQKALKAAQLDRAIEKELLERLKQASSEGEIFNYPERNYQKVLNKAANKYRKSETNDEEQLVDPDEEDLEEEGLEGEEGEAESELEEDAELEAEEEEDAEEEDGELNVEYIEDLDESDIEDDYDEDEEDEDVEDMGNKFSGKKTAAASSSSSAAAALASFYAKQATKGSKSKANSGNETTTKHRLADEKYRGKENNKKRKAGKKGTRVEIEYEHEEEEPPAKIRLTNNTAGTGKGNKRGGNASLDF